MTTRVEVSIGYTRNLGDFNSLRLDIGVGEDARQGETVKDLEKRVYDFVEDRVMERIHEVEIELKATQQGADELVKEAIRNAPRRKRKQQ